MRIFTTKDTGKEKKKLLFNSKKQVTPIERKTYLAVYNFTKKHKIGPSYDELEKILNKTRGAIYRHLMSLQKKGYIKRTNSWRSIDILKMLK